MSPAPRRHASGWRQNMFPRPTRSRWDDVAGSGSCSSASSSSKTRSAEAAAEGLVRFEDVSFRYIPDEPLIEGLSLTVAPGQTVAIVEPTGAGKTTMVNLLLRFYEVDSGRITVDGLDVAELSRDELRSHIGMVLLTQPSILVLDEATSSVDTRTEMLIQQGMARLRHGRTSLIIAHRLSTIRDADVILVMEHGRIVEQGSHDELLTVDGAYARLYAAQFTQLAVA